MTKTQLIVANLHKQFGGLERGTMPEAERLVLLDAVEALKADEVQTIHWLFDNTGELFGCDNKARPFDIQELVPLLDRYLAFRFGDLSRSVSILTARTREDFTRFAQITETLVEKALNGGTGKGGRKPMKRRQKPKTLPQLLREVAHSIRAYHPETHLAALQRAADILENASKFKAPDALAWMRENMEGIPVDDAVLNDTFFQSKPTYLAGLLTRYAAEAFVKTATEQWQSNELPAEMTA